MEKIEQVKIENFTETVKSVDMTEMLELRSTMNSNPELVKKNNQMTQWANLVRMLEPDSQVSRLYHFIIGSTVQNNVCSIDDLEGDLSVEGFLRADLDEREAMIERLNEAYKGIQKAA